MNRRILLLSALAAVILLAAGAAWFVFAGGYHGEVIDTQKPAPEFTLESDRGPVSLSDLRGDYVLIHFGYTFCPDVCPSTLSDLKKVVEGAGELGDDTQVLFITVDPDRDTVKKMGAFSRFFHPDFIGLSGDKETIDRVASDYDITYWYTHEEDPNHYIVNHTAVVIVIDKEGKERLIWHYGISAQDMLSDLRKLDRN